MLVLTRKVGEVIRVGQNIRITVVRTRDDDVRLGIDAPPDVRILRDELKELQDGQDRDPVRSE